MNEYEATWIRLKVFLQGGIDACEDMARLHEGNERLRHDALVRGGVLRTISREMDELLEQTRQRIEVKR